MLIFTAGNILNIVAKSETNTSKYISTFKRITCCFCILYVPVKCLSNSKPSLYCGESKLLQRFLLVFISIEIPTGFSRVGRIRTIGSQVILDYVSKYSTKQ